MIQNILYKNSEIVHFIEYFALDGYWVMDIKSQDLLHISPSLVVNMGFNHLNENDNNTAIKNIKESIDKIATNISDPEHAKKLIINYISSNQDSAEFLVELLSVSLENNQEILIAGHRQKSFNKAKFYTDQLKRYELIIEGTDIGTWEWNVQTGETIFNEKWAEIIGYTLEELGEINIETWVKHCHPDDLEDSNFYLQEYFAGNSKMYDFEARMKHKDGRWIWVHDKGKVISYTPDGKPEWMAGSHQEITASKISREENKRFVNQAPIAMAMFNKNIEYIAASQAWIEDYNLHGIEIIGKSHYEIFPEVKDEWREHHQMCLRGESLKNDAEHFIREDGSSMWIRWEVKPWYFNDGTIGGITMYTQNITEAISTQENLRISEETFRNYFESSAIGMVIVQTDGTLSRVNQSLSNTLGYTKSELQKLTFQELTHPEDLEKDLKLFQQVIDNKINSYQMDKRYIRKNGSIVFAVLSVCVVRKPDKTPLYFVSQITDITPRVEAQINLKNTFSKLEGIINASKNVSIIGTDKEGLINVFNIGAENLLGYKKDEVINQHSPILIHKKEEVVKRGIELSARYKKKVEGFDVFTEVAKRDGYDSWEWTYIRKDGYEFTVLVTVNLIMDGDEIIGYIGVGVDISALKEAEKQVTDLLQLTQHQNDRFSNFAYIVSHNLKTHTNNLNGLIKLFIKQNSNGQDDKIFKFLQKSISGLSETVEHINEVLSINESQLELKKINMLAVFDNTFDNLFLNAEKSDVRLINNIHKECQILGINAYVESIFFNLLSNAIKYRSPDRQSYVRISSTEDEKFITLKFEDNGLGINLNKYKKRLFGMYNTFHKNKEARGIGLFITKNQIEAMGGSIDVISEVSKGSTFIVKLLKA